MTLIEIILFQNSCELISSQQTQLQIKEFCVCTYFDGCVIFYTHSKSSHECQTTLPKKIRVTRGRT